jgi:hypothetical protein
VTRELDPHKVDAEYGNQVSDFGIDSGRANKVQRAPISRAFQEKGE